MKSFSHLFVTAFIASFSMYMVNPSITDITMAAVCPGEDECSLAIYLSGFQQAIIGVGAMVMTPIVGNLSDRYGRKTMLTLPLTLTVIPLAIMAYSRTTNFFYAYYVTKTLTGMVSDGAINSLAFAYVADITLEEQRISVFGILSGVSAAGYVCGTLTTRLLPIAAVFQVAAFMCVFAIVYMRIFLKESLPARTELNQSMLQEEVDGGDEYAPELPTRTQFLKNFPSTMDVISLLMSSRTFSQAATISFISSLADMGMQATLMYFLKARFHFNKNQFANLMIINGVAGAISQLLVMPWLAPAIGEEKLLSIGLLVAFTNMFLHSIAWSVWVPYASTALSMFTVVVSPTICSIASKQVGPHEQGKAQGCISGINSIANIISPLVFSPLTALFLSRDAPIDFPGFSIMCIGLTSLLAFTLSLTIKADPRKINDLV